LQHFIGRRVDLDRDARWGTIDSADIAIRSMKTHQVMNALNGTESRIEVSVQVSTLTLISLNGNLDQST